MARPRHDLLDRLAYVALRVGAMLIQPWPVELVHAVVGGIVDSLLVLPIPPLKRYVSRYRERALGNLRRSFPDMPDRKRQDLARRSLRQIPRLGVDILFTTHLVRLGGWGRYVELENFRQTLELLIKRDSGVIMLSGHYSNFEILGYIMAIFGFPTASVARPLDNPYISRWLFGVRERMGQHIIAKKGATEEVVEVLSQNGVVGFVADQNAGPKGVFVDFFGRKASTYKSIGLLAVEYQVPVVVGYSRRVGSGFRFKVGTEDIIWPADWQEQENPLQYITQRYTTALERIVRKDPSQYWWVHRRWKTRPRGEAPEAFD
jgi:KDO2-lipid IV(A) lauroyltransferase